MNRMFMAGLGLLFPPATLADLPLNVENVIAERGTWKVETGLSYANSERHGVQTGDPIVVQTGPTSFVTIPTLVGEQKSNSDTVVGTIGLRYGVSANTEVYGRTSWLWHESRVSGLTGTRSKNTNRFADAWLGVNHQFSPDDETPALLGFAEVALRERHIHDSASGKSYLLGFTAYRAHDPVVLSLTGAFRIATSRRDGAITYRPGSMFMINPSFGFAVNDRVTLTTGLQWTSRQPDRHNGQSSTHRRTSTDLALGLAYGVTPSTVLSFTAKANVSGSDGAELRFTLVYVPSQMAGR